MPRKECPETLLRDLGTPRTGDWVVLDGYHFGPDCQLAVREAGYRLLVVDDYAHLPEYFCDILLNQNPGAASLPYRGDITKKLTGPGYALLRPEFAVARETKTGQPPAGTPQNILLTLGGGNFSSHLRTIALCFALPELRGRTLRVLAGGMPEESIRKSLADCPARLEILHQVEDMPALLLDTDLCITAGGSTCWELCCLGVPFLTVVIAENQLEVVTYLGKRHLAALLTKERLRASLAGSYTNTEQLQQFVDGYGCRQVLSNLELFSAITIRPAMPEDCLAVLALANDPVVRGNSVSTRPIDEADHTQWYSRRLALDSCPFYLAFCGDDLVGYVRYDDKDENGSLTVSIALAGPWRGKGLGAWLLRECDKRVFAMGRTPITAWVKPENQSSQAFFKNCGYVLQKNASPDDTALLKFTMHPPHFSARTSW